MSKLTFAWPAPGGNEWSPEAAQSLIGQKITFDGRPGRVTACTLAYDGTLSVEIQTTEDSEGYRPRDPVTEENTSDEVVYVPPIPPGME